MNLSGRWNDLDLFELGIDGWRLSACMVGITLIQVAMVADSIFGGRWPKAEWMAWSPQDGITCACGCERSER